MKDIYRISIFICSLIVAFCWGYIGGIVLPYIWMKLISAIAGGWFFGCTGSVISNLIEDDFHD